ncbi:hypothetical protein R5R35_002658 [Gryllus longicercus]|uniref:Evolutionarily conserved signaling intermediate in Toll pathway, mitochondrial n=1 Tax=Gryllus longicercus TaxID=2509291 RepID=A0AAN9VYC1_9ORTH
MFISGKCVSSYRLAVTLTRCYRMCQNHVLISYHGRLNDFPVQTLVPKVAFSTEKESKELVLQDYFNSENKDKETYLCMVDMFKGRDIHRRGHVEFIYAALRHMEEFNVHKDLEVYKSLIDILPKGKFIPQNIFQAEFMHYPKQQQCAIDILEKMEDNGVIPDKETETILLNIFGRRGYPLRKYWRMMYWMPKFKNLSPWPLPNPVPSDAFELSMMAIKRISSVDVETKVAVYQAEDIPESLDKTWIISAQSPRQKELLAQNPENSPIYVEGAFRIWLRNAQVNYFILRSDYHHTYEEEKEDEDDVSRLEVPLVNQPTSKIVQAPSVHEQEDGTILAVCATGTSSRDSLLSWIRLLERDGNPSLSRMPILFTSKSPLGAVIQLEDVKAE